MNLDQFIEARTQDGELESQGSFSVDGLSALRKTLASALPEPHYYLFQLLQALNRAKCGDIKVAIGRRENRISFSDQQGAFSDLDAIASRFQKGLNVSSSEPADLLMTGLITSLGSHVSEAELQVGEEKLVVSVQGLSRSKLPRSQARPSILLRRTLDKGLTYSWSRIWGARKEEFRVRKAFEHSPDPFLIAGLPTKPRHSWRRGIEGDGRLVLLEAIISSDEQNHRGEALDKIEQIEGHEGLYFCHLDSELPDGSDLAVAPNIFLKAFNEEGELEVREPDPQAWRQRKWTFSFSNCGNEKAEILFVRNGLNLQTYELDLGMPGIHIVAPADDLTVDASGYKIVENFGFENRIEDLKSHLQMIKNSVTAEELSSALEKLGHDPAAILSQFEWLCSGE